MQATISNTATETKRNREVKKGYTRILGYWVKVGSNRHSILVDTKKHLDDLRVSETNEWKAKKQNEIS